MDDDNEHNNNNDQGLGAPWDEENNIEIEIEDGNDRDANGDLDGGIAINPDGTSNSNRATMDCDLVCMVVAEYSQHKGCVCCFSLGLTPFLPQVLYLECEEEYLRLQTTQLSRTWMT